MSTEQQPVWVEWVDGVRRGDAAAREELVNYFTPFVHGVLACHVASQGANELVAGVLDDLLRRIGEPRDALAFGPWLVDQTRERAKEVARKPGSTLEMPGGGAVMTEGKKVLSRLRHLPELQRERLAFRLLEGITGAEIAEVTGAPAAEVRGQLESGFAALVHELGGGSVNAVGDAYLWSLVGTPHPAVVPLENQLTPLRYDPSAAVPEVTPSAGGPAMPEVTPIEGQSLEVTPMQAPSPLERRSGEGRRQTAPEMKAVRASTPDDEPQTTPIGVKLVDDPVSQKLVEDPTSVLPGADASAADQTRNATDLPIAAKENPFAAQPSTVQASDLPVAAGVDRASRPVAPELTDSLGASSAPETKLRPRTLELAAVKTAAPQTAKQKEDPDSTAPRGVPLTMLAKEYDAPTTGSTSPTPADPGQDWRTSAGALDEQTRIAQAPVRPRPFSFTRGLTPFVVATVFFVFFLVIAYINIRGTRQIVRSGWVLVPIIVAAQSIPEGTIIDLNMISTRDAPEAFVTSSVVKPDSVPYVLNQRIVVPVQAGDPLLWSQFESAKANERLSRRINHRARAYTIDGDDIVSVGGWVQPGDRVDLVITLKDPQTSAQMAATRMQNIQVIATGKLTAMTNTAFTKPGQRKYTDVSVLALPEEIEVLALMRFRAHYRLVLRADDDMEIFADGRTSAETLISGERMKVLQRKRTETLVPLIRNYVPAPTR